MDNHWEAWPNSDDELQPEPQVVAPEQPPEHDEAREARRAARHWRREVRRQPVWPEQHAGLHSFETSQNEDSYRKVRGALEQAAAAAEAAAVRASLETHQREEAAREVRRQMARRAASVEQEGVIALYEAQRELALQGERRRNRPPSEQAQLHRLRLQARAERAEQRRLAAASQDGAGPSNQHRHDEDDEA